jgi:ABC-type uncharacterized transport system ATPase subunit
MRSDGDAPTEVLTLSCITKRFGPLLAVHDATFSLHQGEIHALVGENGAGKSTLMNIAYGIHKPDDGAILLDGKAVALASPADALGRGIGMVPQHFKLAPSFSVAENIVVGAEPRASWGRIDRGAAVTRTRALGIRFGLELDPAARVGDLPVGLQQRVEILKALHREVRLLILDEPTAVLTPQETRELFVTMGVLAAAGTAIIFITHKLREVLAVSHRISVMRRGEIVETLPNKSVTAEHLAKLMVGRAVLLRVAKTTAAPHGADALRIGGLSAIGERGETAVRDVSLTVRPGEIVGIAGVQGNGQDELIEVVTGFRRPSAGHVSIAGTDITGADTRRARRAGLAYVPADRLHLGLSPQSTVWENLALGRHREPVLAAGPLLRLRLAKLRAGELIRRFDIRGATVVTPARALSGGNQQKVVLARELGRDAKLIIVEQPSQGVDIGAIEAIHRLLIRMRDEGHAILLVSADLDEILALSDRILVMFRGAIAGELAATVADAETIGRLMGGIGTEPAHVR